MAADQRDEDPAVVLQNIQSYLASRPPEKVAQQLKPDGLVDVIAAAVRSVRRIAEAKGRSVGGGRGFFRFGKTVQVDIEQMERNLHAGEDLVRQLAEVMASCMTLPVDYGTIPPANLLKLESFHLLELEVPAVTESSALRKVLLVELPTVGRSVLGYVLVVTGEDPVDPLAPSFIPVRAAEAAHIKDHEWVDVPAARPGRCVTLKQACVELANLERAERAREAEKRSDPLGLSAEEEEEDPA